MKIKNCLENIFAYITVSIILIGCSYSFTGSSVPSHLKTIYIPFCVDRSGSGEPNMADDFTNTLIQNFINDNSFILSLLRLLARPPPVGNS